MVQKNKLSIFLLISVIVLVIGVNAYSIDQDRYSSSGSLSYDSTKGLSSTKVTTISSSSQNQPEQTETVQSPLMQIPPSWILDVNTATFFDPVTNTAWIFDRILQKFYCPNTGWFLVSLYYNSYSGDFLFKQYYYNPVTGEFFDINTGQVLISNPLSTKNLSRSGMGQSGSSSTGIISSSPLPSTTSGIISSDTNQGNSNSIAGLEENAQSSFMPKITLPNEEGTSENPQSAFLPYECPILVCNECYEGYCIDCNNDGICDETADFL